MAAILFAGCANQNGYSETGATNVGAGKAPVLIITSPRHPRTFDVEANDKLSQELRWNPTTQSLSAVVTYSYVSGGGDDELDPANYRVLELPFPNVHVDEKSNLFALNDHKERVSLGHLESGIFGDKVVLNNNVRLSAHRHENELAAKLIISAQ
jgi:hypothetical protein